MQIMMQFSTWLLSAIADFLSYEPIMCLWGVVIFGYIFKILLSFRHFD